MKPVAFRYCAPDSVEEALAALAEAGLSGKALAGGQSLVPMMNFRLARPEVVVDLNHIESLTGIRVDAEHIVLGALTRHQAVAESADLAAALPLLGQTARAIGHWAIRNRGTVGGSLAHADPAAEWPAVLKTLGAAVVVASVRGRRTLSVDELVLGPLTVALEPDELITEVRIPRPPRGDRFGFDAVARRPGDFALVGAVARWRAAGGADLTWFGLSGRPETRRLQEPGADSDGAAIGQLLQDVQVLGDLHATEAWRRQVAVTVALRALKQAQNTEEVHA